MEVIVGGLITISIALFIEHYRRPKLRITITDNIERSYPKHPAKKAKFLLLKIENVKPILKFIQRNPALQCRGFITFYHLDGQNYFGRVMKNRWNESPEPIPITFHVNNQLGQIYDPLRYNLDSFVDIHTDNPRITNVVARFDEDEECYGWSNENYFSDPVWRNKDWLLPKGRYLVNVEIVTSGNKFAKQFRIINDVNFNDFRLENVLKDDKIANSK